MVTSSGIVPDAGADRPAPPCRVRVSVERMNYSACGLEIGDYFEVQGSRLSLPPGKSFCYFAMAAAIPLLDTIASDLPPDHWLARKPYVCCPDPPEALVMRLERLPEDTAARAGAGGQDG